MNILLAQADSLPINWKYSLIVFIGLIGILVIVALVFTVTLQWKKLFSRRPPIEEELTKLEEKLHREILESFTRAFTNGEEAKILAAEIGSKLERVHTELTDAGQKREDNLRGEIKGVRDQMNLGFKDMERAIGRLEGRLAK